ncbi:MAG: hypothetical protein LKF52_11595 [Butyrivibrio sp.]|nr:hypothetical protein [Butyrivibrio sp.]
MNLHYNQNYSKEEIDAVLDKIKSCVSSKQKSILLQLKTEDFCHTLQNTKLGYEYEVLYVFVPQVQLFNADGVEGTVDVYTKFNVIDLPNGSRTVVISFHKRNKPIDYLFR